MSLQGCLLVVRRSSIYSGICHFSKNVDAKTFSTEYEFSI